MIASNSVSACGNKKAFRLIVTDCPSAVSFQSRKRLKLLLLRLYTVTARCRSARLLACCCQIQAAKARMTKPARHSDFLSMFTLIF